MYILFASLLRACCCYSQYYETTFEVYLLANITNGGAQRWIFSQDDLYGNGGNYLPKSSPYYPKNFDASTGNLPPYVYSPGCSFPLNSSAPLVGMWLADSGTLMPCCRCSANTPLDPD